MKSREGLGWIGWENLGKPRPDVRLVTILLHKSTLFVCVCVCTVCVCACDDDVSAASPKDTSTAEVYVKSLCITLL